MKRIAMIVPSLALVLVVLTAAATWAPSFADERDHRLAIHVDENDVKKMKIALNNAKNATNYYQSKGEKVAIEIVAYGPGLHMLRADTSPVRQDIAAMSMEYDNVSFAACGNTQDKMKKKENKAIPLIPEAKRVTAGVVRLMELQEQGWSYVKP